MSRSDGSRVLTALIATCVMVVVGVVGICVVVTIVEGGVGGLEVWQPAWDLGDPPSPEVARYEVEAEVGQRYYTDEYEIVNGAVVLSEGYWLDDHTYRDNVRIVAGRRIVIKDRLGG